MMRMAKKIKTSISLDQETLKWMDKQIETKKFRNRSHIIEYAIEQLKKQEG
jgi:Arc/MetJ-type ribon-helix-helix transcriptional regulator